MKLNFEPFQLNNKVVAVACSGGVDSMALLYYMQKNSLLYGFTLKAVNVEHGIRGQDSIDDSAFVEKYCKDNDIPLKTYKVNAPEIAKVQKLSLEQAGRKLRYECFLDAVSSGFADLIATAHHISDNTETVLFNLFRGSSLKGIKGIAPINDFVIRPLLDVDKAEILAYAKKNGIPFVTDKTNDDTDYTRNFLRHKVVPVIKEIFPSADQAVKRLSSTVREEDEFLDELAKESLSLGDGVAEIPLGTHPVLFRRAVIIALKSLGVTKDYEKLHADLTLLLTEKENGDKLSLPKGLTAIKEYDKIVIFAENQVSFSEVPFTVGKFDLPDGVLTVEPCEMPTRFGDGAFYIDADKVPNSAVLRLRSKGDTFTKFGGKTKKLKDYLIDIKYPARRRERLVVLGDKKIVLLVIGIEISEQLRVDKHTKNVLKLVYTNHQGEKLCTQI
jgi:tRNA(Ile)-lysidine synthase